MRQPTAVYVRALRLPFATASIMPYVFGSFTAGRQINWLIFIIGLLGVVSTHLAANLLNDYADNRSGADCQDNEYYAFYGGSKLIQQGVLSSSFYFKYALFFVGIACAALVVILLMIQDYRLIFIVFSALFLAINYSCKPLAFSYHGLGEVVLSLLFGPFTVLGAAFIQGQYFLSPHLITLSLIFGFLAGAILIANEIPDTNTDAAVNKNTLVVLAGQRNGWLLYGLAILAAYILIIVEFSFDRLGWLALISIFLLPLPLKAVRFLHQEHEDKKSYMAMSRVVILHQLTTGVCLILGIIQNG